MESNYHSKDFCEIPSNHSHGDSDNLEDSHNFCHNFTSSDESFTSNSSAGASSSSDKSFEKKNDVMRSSDLMSDSLRSRTSFNGVNNAEAGNHKSFGSIIKMLKNLNLRHEKPRNKEHKHSILRAPTEYTFVKGLSGLNLKVPVIKESAAACCQRCISKN